MNGNETIFLLVLTIHEQMKYENFNELRVWKLFKVRSYVEFEEFDFAGVSVCLTKKNF